MTDDDATDEELVDRSRVKPQRRTAPPWVWEDISYGEWVRRYRQPEELENE